MSNSSFNEELLEFAKEYKHTEGLEFYNDFFSNGRKENSESIVKYFMQLFPSLSNNFLSKLVIASNFYFFSILAIDKLIDEEKSFDKEALLLAIALRENSLHRMYRLIEPSSEYWKHFETYYKQYLYAVSIELKNHIGKVNDISIEKLELLYSGNSALAKALPVAMAFKGDNKIIIKDIEKSIDYFYIALNLYDDVNDWKKDWQNKQFSYLITKTIINNNLNISEVNTEQLGKYIFFKHEASSCLELSISYYNKAKKVLSNIKCDNWKSAIQNDLARCRNLKEDLDMLISKQLASTSLTKNKARKDGLPLIKFDSVSGKLDTSLKNGIKYILNQWENGFVEATLYSYFPDVGGYLFDQRYYKGDLFQRAVISEIIFDINLEFNNCLLPFLDFETKYLSDQIQSNGGWNFYHDFEYQPNDTDTTAQVMQVLIKMKRQDLISKKTIQVLDKILEQQFNENGKIKTWLLPSFEKQNTRERKQYQFLKYYTGHNLDKSVDVEVMANLLYTLQIFNKEKYNMSIKHGIEFLEKNQNKNGSWTSTWYWGEYYGTYLCLKLFTEIKLDSKSINKAKDFLLKNNTSSKAWGYKKSTNDPLNTAYALISLHYLKKLKQQIPIERIKDACTYLREAITDPGELKKSDYINLRKQKFSSFKSNSITLAYALKALSIWKNLI